MSTLAIFLYGVFVFAIVSAALGLIAYGIVADRRARAEAEEEGGRSGGATEAGFPGAPGSAGA